jgi:L,D-transpeptidase catalytic domain
MRTLINPVSLRGLALVLLLAPTLAASPSPRANPLAGGHRNGQSRNHASFSAAFEEQVSALYEQIDLRDMGLSRKAFEYAYKGYTYLMDHHLLNRENILSICDFSQSSRNKRLYIIDLDQHKVLINTYVAHGRKSGSEFARSFSNGMQSHKSSLGFYLTEHSYYGDHGLSLKIHGLEKGFNDRAARRAIVVHGSDYVGEEFIRSNPFTGRSYGCPAVPTYEAGEVIETIEDGSCLFIYHPTAKYLKKSKILNS